MLLLGGLLSHLGWASVDIDSVKMLGCEELSCVYDVFDASSDYYCEPRVV